MNDANMAAVAAVVRSGRENAIPLDVLARLAGITQRDVRNAVYDINTSGSLAIIREPRKGYYIPESQEELDHYIRFNDSYRKRLNSKLRGMKRYREEHFSDAD